MSFVVQEHHATRLHWDFRVARQGVLKSWAVPKQPPQRSGIRRLAMQVEDHPLSYASFAGTIPAGEYGAGSVRIWDRGRCTVKTFTRQLVELVLAGKRLQGTYVLVRFPTAGPKAWLLFKRRQKAEVRRQKREVRRQK